jgi:hypothetical protein
MEYVVDKFNKNILFVLQEVLKIYFISTNRYMVCSIEMQRKYWVNEGTFCYGCIIHFMLSTIFSTAKNLKIGFQNKKPIIFKNKFFSSVLQNLHQILLKRISGHTYDLR